MDRADVLYQEYSKAVDQIKELKKEIVALKEERNHWREVALHSQQKASEYLNEVEELELDLASLPHAIACY